MKRSAIFAILLTVVVATPMFAASPQTANLTVSASVIKNCTIATAAVAFGNYDPTSATDKTASGRVDVRCTKGTATTIELGNGSNFSGSRRMTDGTSFLSYSLWQDAAATATPWGSLAATEHMVWSAPDASLNQIPVYGRIPANQDALASGVQYTDTVVATINF